MKLDHLVINIDEKYQKCTEEIESIRDTGILYEPKFGKGTKGFKATNLWFGTEYFEMINILQEDGGGWIPEWTRLYNKGMRGVVCIFLDVEDINQLYENIQGKGIDITKPEWLKFKWFFNILTRTMPWMNSYLPFFEELPIQLGFQQMKDAKSRDFMNQYMYPNSRDNGIDGISEVIVYGMITDNDLEMLKLVFEDKVSNEKENIVITLSSNQRIVFKNSNKHYVEVITTCSNTLYKDKEVVIENVKVTNN